MDDIDPEVFFYFGGFVLFVALCVMAGDYFDPFGWSM